MCENSIFFITPRVSWATQSNTVHVKLESNSVAMFSIDAMTMFLTSNLCYCRIQPTILADLFQIKKPNVNIQSNVFTQIVPLCGIIQRVLSLSLEIFLIVLLHP